LKRQIPLANHAVAIEQPAELLRVQDEPNDGWITAGIGSVCFEER
jgi:hypothetical protein